MIFFKENTGKFFMWIGILIFIISIASFLLSDSRVFDSEYGQLGDFIGGLVGSLWAFAGVVLFYVALTEQREDININRDTLELQIKEFKQQTEELKETRKAYIDQSNTLKQQRFENTFFQLLANHNSIVNSLDIRKEHSGTIVATGRDCFRTYYNDFKAQLNRVQDISTMDYILNTYTDLTFKRFEADLGHYFRNLYHIIKFVDGSDDIDDKKKYVTLIRAQLSSYELVLLFYNCLTFLGEDKFKPLVERYSFLKNLNHSLIFFNDKLANEFDLKAYA